MSRYYDTLIVIGDIIVPSKQIDFKKDLEGNPILKPQTKSVREFETYIKKTKLKEYAKHFDWPLQGDLFVYAGIGLFENDYKNKDVDNIIKTLFDSMKGIVFEDDAQISTLLATKIISKKQTGFTVAIKCISNDPEEMVWVTNPIFSRNRIQKWNELK